MTKSDSVQLISLLIVSRLDYCNYALAGLPFEELSHLQRIQNNDARLVFKKSRFYRTPCVITHTVQSLQFSFHSHCHYYRTDQIYCINLMLPKFIKGGVCRLVKFKMHNLKFSLSQTELVLSDHSECTLLLVLGFVRLKMSLFR